MEVSLQGHAGEVAGMGTKLGSFSSSRKYNLTFPTQEKKGQGKHKIFRGKP